MERTILQCLDFKIARPTRVDFLQYLEKIYSLTKRQNCLAHYLLGLSFFDFDLNYHRMSVTAAAALIVTFQVIMNNLLGIEEAINLTMICMYQSLPDHVGVRGHSVHGSQFV